jgi:hypothetical protein
VSGAHTPGPWLVNCCTKRGTGFYRHQIANQEGSDADVIAVIECNSMLDYPPDDPVAEANARLIAAAPDLLEALRQIEMHAGGALEDADPVKALQFIVNEARAVLAKALG